LGDCIHNVIYVLLEFAYVIDLEIEVAAREEVGVGTLVCVEIHEGMQKLTVHVYVRVHNQQYLSSGQYNQEHIQKYPSREDAALFVLRHRGKATC